MMQDKIADDMPDQDPPTSKEGMVQLLEDLIDDIWMADRIRFCEVLSQIGTVDGLNSDGAITQELNGDKILVLRLRYQMPLV